MHTTRIDDVQEFLAQSRIAVVGVSRDANDFSARLFRDLRTRGYDAIPVNPNAQAIDGLPCYDSVQAVYPPADAVLVMTPPAVTDTVVKDCALAGIRRVWLYKAAGQGAANEAAIEFCVKSGMRVVAGECPYMFLPESGWVHSFHGLIKKITRSYPAA